MSLKKKPDANLPTEEPAIKKDIFIFANGDRYDGEYSMSTDGSCYRHGNGISTSQNGLVLQGNWEDDQINGKSHVIFPSGDSYEGNLVNNTFSGYGVYTLANGGSIEGTFENNLLIGSVIFRDDTEKVWTGNFTGTDFINYMKLKIC